MHPAPHPELLAAIGQATDLILNESDCQPVAGGDISSAFRCVDRRNRAWFLKLNRIEFADAFAAEQAGLEELQQVDGIRVPRARGSGITDAQSWLLLEWLDLQPPGTASAEQLGNALAGMHRITAECCGNHRDNYIGATPQLNTDTADWVMFYCAQRLRPQLQLAAQNGAPADFSAAGEALLSALPEKLAGYTPAASLLHGDLWSGNVAQLPDGYPAIFDPAVYYGDRETDLAMTRLFGGFPPQFYAAYEAAWPLDDGHEYRLQLYQLYHVLNHYNLFGGAYLAQAARMLDTLLV
ncbi:MAG: phosphotransferase [Gammaproteobacteria bacterium]|nr:phosphotransferase [Gammaproteobacteria bacterium]